MVAKPQATVATTATEPSAGAMEWSWGRDEPRVRPVWGGIGVITGCAGLVRGCWGEISFSL